MTERQSPFHGGACLHLDSHDSHSIVEVIQGQRMLFKASSLTLLPVNRPQALDNAPLRVLDLTSANPAHM